MHRPRAAGVEILLAEPEALGDDVLESCFNLRDKLRGMRGKVWEEMDYALPTHSSVPSVNRWCFQIGTVAFSSSISA